MSEHPSASRIFAEGEFIIQFMGDGMVTADVVADSLAGWNGLYHRVPAILGVHYPAFKSMELFPFVESIDHGSMVARIIARLVLKDEQAAQQLENDIDALTDLATQTLLKNVARMNIEGKNVIYAALGGALVWGFMNVRGHLDRPQRETITNASGLVINNSAISLNVTPAVFTGMIDAATKDNARLTKQSLAALRPAGVLSNASVRIGEDNTNLVVSSDAAQIVARINPADLKDRIETRRTLNTPIDIRAIDLDRKTSGWAAVFPAISPHRVRVTLADTVQITTAGSFRGDIDLDVAIDLDGREKPKSARILRLN